MHLDGGEFLLRVVVVRRRVCVVAVPTGRVPRPGRRRRLLQLNVVEAVIRRIGSRGAYPGPVLHGKYTPAGDDGDERRVQGGETNDDERERKALEWRRGGRRLGFCIGEKTGQQGAV